MSNDCPFTFPVPDDVESYDVPEHMRETIVTLWVERERLNEFPQASFAEAHVWYGKSQAVYEAFEMIESDLRLIAKASLQSHVEYFAGWRFRCADAATLKAEHLARLKKDR